MIKAISPEVGEKQELSLTCWEPVDVEKEDVTSLLYDLTTTSELSFFKEDMENKQSEFTCEIVVDQGASLLIENSDLIKIGQTTSGTTVTTTYEINQNSTIQFYSDGTTVVPLKTIKFTSENLLAEKELQMRDKTKAGTSPKYLYDFDPSILLLANDVTTENKVTNLRVKLLENFTFTSDSLDVGINVATPKFPPAESGIIELDVKTGKTLTLFCELTILDGLLLKVPTAEKRVASWQSAEVKVVKPAKTKSKDAYKLLLDPFEKVEGNLMYYYSDNESFFGIDINYHDKLTYAFETGNYSNMYVNEFYKKGGKIDGGLLYFE